jgi:dihydroxyacid dehydratase/phosphogluconate dehydratase
VIAIVNTWSDINPCYAHFKQHVEEVKRGVWEAGDFPVEMVAMSLSEPFQKPTTMLYRNLLAMETEELLRSYPADGAVLMGGCDKTTPGLLMGAASMDLPALTFPAGPMLRRHWGGTTLGSGSDTWKYWADLRAGAITQQDWQEIENGIAGSPGHCMTMGTASTMTSAPRRWGDAGGRGVDPGGGFPARGDGDAHQAADRRDGVAGRAAFDAAVAHRVPQRGDDRARAGRVDQRHRASDRDGPPDRRGAGSGRLRGAVAPHPAVSQHPSGGKYLMEDFFYAGGLPALLAQLGDLLDTSAPTANGQTLGENVVDAKVFDDDVIRSRDNPLVASDTLAILYGNLAPNGAVIKPAAAETRLHRHSGPAVVFANYDDMAARIDDPDLISDENSVIVLQNAGPQGAPGMPEWGQLPLPKKLLEQGVRDMVRISDARMSGTSYGACVLHVAPESAVGGPLALVHDGDLVELDVAARKLALHAGEDELEKRRADWHPPAPKYGRGYGALYLRHITQANEGCDFDFLAAGPPTPEPEIH